MGPTCWSATGRWMRSTPTWASLLLVHGLGEHSGRYEHVGSQFAAAGIESWAYDHRGNGGSGGRRGHVDAWSEYHADLADRLAAVRDGAADGRSSCTATRWAGWSSPATCSTTRSRADVRSRTSSSSASPALEFDAGPVWKQTLAPILGNVVPTLAVPNGIDGSTLSRDPSVGTQAADDPLSSSASTTPVRCRGACRAGSCPPARVPRLRTADARPSRTRRPPRPGDGIGGLRGRPERRAPHLPGTPPRAPQRARGPGHPRRRHRLDPRAAPTSVLPWGIQLKTPPGSAIALRVWQPPQTRRT